MQHCGGEYAAEEAHGQGEERLPAEVLSRGYGQPRGHAGADITEGQQGDGQALGDPEQFQQASAQVVLQRQSALKKLIPAGQWRHRCPWSLVPSGHRRPSTALAPFTTPPAAVVLGASSVLRVAGCLSFGIDAIIRIALGMWMPNDP